MDKDAYETHTQTPLFTELVVGDAIPHLAARERAFYETLKL